MNHFLLCIVFAIGISDILAAPSSVRSSSSSDDGACSTATSILRPGPLSEKTFRDLILEQNICPNQEPCNNFAAFTCKPGARSPLDDQFEHNNELINQLFSDDHEDGDESSNLASLKQFYKSCKAGQVSEQTVFELVDHMMSYLNICQKPDAEQEPVSTKSILSLFHQYLAVKLGKNRNDQCIPKEQFDWRAAVLEFRNLGLDYEQFFKINMQTKGEISQFRLTRPLLPDLHTNLHYRIILLSHIPILNYDDMQGRIWRVMQFREDVDRLTKPVYNNSHKKEKVYWLRKLSGNEALTDAAIDQDEIDLSNLERVIDEAEAEVISDYMIINFMESLKRMKENLALPGNYCLETLHDKMGLVLSSEYSRLFLSPAKVKQVQKLVDELRIDLVNLIDKMDWMSPAVRQQSKNQARSINVVIGFPETMLNKWIDSPHFDAEQDHLSNLLLASKFKNGIQSVMLSREAHAYPLNLYSKARKITAVARPEMNSIFLTWAILGGFFFDDTQPQGLNYATLGYVIAREFAHSLDERANNIYAKKTPELKWDRQTIGEFRKLKDCLVNQYTQAAELTIDGEATFVENFADLVGQQLAYRGYQRWLRSEQGRGVPLTNFRYDPKKLFWIVQANLHCPTNGSSDKLIVASKKYSPSHVRATQPAKNSIEFEIDFSCPRESPMTMPRQDKCLFWKF